MVFRASWFRPMPKIVTWVIVATTLMLFPFESSALPCNNSQARTSYTVRDSDDALRLAQVVNCSGGSFDVNWVAHVVVEESIHVFGGTILNISGRADGTSLIDGDQSNIFYVNNATLHILHVTIVNAVGSYGGAIAAIDSFVTVTSCTFSNNVGDSGGGMYLSGCYAEVDDSIFVNNTAVGGAIYAANSSLALEGSVYFAANNAPPEWYGGAFVAVDSNVSVPGDVTFENNQADFGGAAVLISGDLVVDGRMEFFRNNATSSAGGLYAFEFAITIIGATVWEDNEAGHAAGALLLIDSEFTSTSCTFVSNRGPLGGAIYTQNSEVDLKESTFLSNSAVEWGGAVMLVNSTLELGDLALFENNSTPLVEDAWGGALFATGSNVTVFGKAIFLANSAYSGGGILAASVNLLVEGQALFLGNQVVDVGGAIYGEKFAALITGNASLAYNDALFGAGAFLYLDSELVVTGDVSFHHNQALQGGAIWISERSTVVILGSSTFESNQATDAGGAVLAQNGVASFPGHATFFNNSATNGGCVTAWTGGGLKVEGHVAFLENYALERGGAVALLEGTYGLFGEDVTMIGNRAGSSGGALYAEALASVDGLNITGVLFSSNYAAGDGGAITMLSVGVKDNYAHIVRCEFADSEAVEAGGALFIAGGFMNIIGSTFSRNIAGRAGGAILASGVINVDECTFSRNRAFLGPAISNTVYLEIASSTFDDNTLFCDETAFLDWVNESAYATACDSCPDECLGCVVEDEGRVQHCETILAHTSSTDREGNLTSLDVERGYWRDSYTSRQIVECYESSACMGGLGPYCSEGYEGPYCAVCSEGYASGLGYTCSRCSDERRRVSIALASILGAICFAIVAFGFRVLRSEMFVKRSPQADSYFRFKRARAFQALKIMIVAWQIVSQFTAVASVTYPTVYETFLQYIDFANLDLGWLLSAGCLVETDFYDELRVITLVPLGIFAVVAVSYATIARRSLAGGRNQDATVTMKRRHISVLFWVSFFVYSTASSAVFKVFACDTLDSGVSYLRVDHRLQCYTPTHRFFMSYASLMILAYPVGIPLCYLQVLYRNRQKLVSEERETASDTQLFKDLWQPYRPQMFYYEIVECTRRMFLAGIVVFILPNTAGQVATSFLLALVFFFVLMALDPYENLGDTWLSRIGHAVVMMSMFVALMMKVDATDDDSASQRVFGVALVAANCVMVVAVAAEACGMCFVAVQETREIESDARRGDTDLEMSHTERHPAWEDESSEGEGVEHHQGVDQKHGRPKILPDPDAHEGGESPSTSS